MGLITKRNNMATAPKVPRRDVDSDTESEVMDFANKTEDFIESCRSKMTDTERAEADAKASALFDELRAKR